MWGSLRRRGERAPAVVTLVTRAGCHLCEQAAPVVAREARRAGAVFQERDVDAAPEDRASYGDKVPVVLLDDVEHCYWQVDPEALRAALGARK